MAKKPRLGPKILTLDIETAPMLAYVWGIWEVNIPLNMIKRDWSILSWSAKWFGDPASKVMYQDQSKAKDIFDDKRLLQDIWNLLDEADIVVGQNVKKFDIKKLNARFLKHKMGKPSPYRVIDTQILAKRHFALTSNKLEYMSTEFNEKYKKQKHEEFGGFSLWEACMAGNKKAWKAMKKYNIFDVLSTEELAITFLKWDDSINFNAFTDDLAVRCSCGSCNLKKRGYNFSNTGRFQRYQCSDCGAWTSSKHNLLSKEKKLALRIKE